MSVPCISIVTISFNQARFIRDCVESVLSQKDDAVEYIVVDPGSSDGSRAILEEYKDQIDHLIFEPDAGPSDGLNKGFEKAKGEIGYFINSDDFLLNGAVKCMLDLWQAHEGIDILLGGGWMVDAQGNPIRELRAESAGFDALLSGRVPLVQQGMSFRMSHFRSIGGFEVKNRTCWDQELACAMLAQGADAMTTQQRFGAFRIYDESLSGGVGGSAHWQQYQHDIMRIQDSLGAGRAFKSPFNRNLFSRARQLIASPSRTLLWAEGKIFPSLIQSRFRRDQSPNSSSMLERD